MVGWIVGEQHHVVEPLSSKHFGVIFSVAIAVTEEQM